jgi:hypothetical protein
MQQNIKWLEKLLFSHFGFYWIIPVSYKIMPKKNSDGDDGLWIPKSGLYDDLI